MKRALLILCLAALGILALPAARKVAGGRPDVCALMTPAKLLEAPELAEAYAEALRSGDDGEVGHVEDLMREIRSAHGCQGDVALPPRADGGAASPPRRDVLPPGHPPVGGRAAPLGDRELPVAPFSATPDPVTI